MDWIMRRSTKEEIYGLEWRDDKRLADLDFADDIALLDNTWSGMIELTKRVEAEAGRAGLRINATKSKVMRVGHWETTQEIRAGGEPIDEVDDFGYLGSVIASDGSCDKEVRCRLGKASAVFGRLNSIWRNKGLSLHIKIRLYKAIVLSTLLYSSETWPMTVANLKRLEAAHHRWQRKILGITWGDKIRNEEIRRRTGMEKIEEVMKRTRLRWLGHLHRMDEDRIPKQAMDWVPSGWKRKRGRPRKNWKDTISKDLADGGLTWEEAAGAARDRDGWRTYIAQCAHSTWRD